jgi:hypothetical protein
MLLLRVLWVGMCLLDIVVMVEARMEDCVIIWQEVHGPSKLCVTVRPVVLLRAGSNGHAFQLKTLIKVTLGKVEQRSCSGSIFNRRLSFHLEGDVEATTKLHERRDEKISRLGVPKATSDGWSVDMI